MTHARKFFVGFRKTFFHLFVFILVWYFPPPAVGGSTVVGLGVSSPEFNDGKNIPVPYTCDGSDISPPLDWTEGPAGTKSFALICDDPDAPNGEWVHWIVFNIKPTVRQLEEGIELAKKRPLARAGRNSFRRETYGGPCPPPGKKHRYYFRVYALDCTLEIKSGCNKRELLKAMEGHVLARGELMGTYGRSN